MATLHSDLGKTLEKKFKQNSAGFEPKKLGKIR